MDVGEFCSVYQDHVLTNLPATRGEAGETWAFVVAKQRSVTQDRHGDIWTLTAIDRDSKLKISWLVGGRSSANARSFMEDVASRLVNRVQPTIHGHQVYLTAVASAFGYNKVDYAQLVETPGQVPDLRPGRKYRPPVCADTLRERVMGKPDPDLVSTSFVKRANLSVRMGMRRFSRLTNGFSKKAENHAHVVSLYFRHYNFCRDHTTLTKASGGAHTTPAMAAGVTDRGWSIEAVIALMEPANLVG